ncbi:uncharacterized protein BO80DRAFT_96814 [Aspergillus ibericus CBS 121593]|uniref:Uncharacterized protein n=1 Tax=Aspergillus ibericus CBS 121593 TaxID=1448316 RepID=A0A395GYG7_9EURO|nr:hypothetical protein BO80DRAFT_96814 [Aspergillus ibericus CBS 121593]RAL00400.1 hypothetical protein BO80DRAFT_96814 [Aspergillus ibericus CBS 121593]
MFRRIYRPPTRLLNFRKRHLFATNAVVVGGWFLAIVAFPIRPTGSKSFHSVPVMTFTKGFYNSG